MPFEGDFTKDDRIVQTNSQGIQVVWMSNAAGTEFGRTVHKKVGHKIITVWEPGVEVGPVTVIDPTTQEEVQAPVWFIYCGDGLCVVKLPNSETVEPVET